nr:MAG TPA: hypothetical protein [Caudoviricetes sp.]
MTGGVVLCMPFHRVPSFSKARGFYPFYPAPTL